MTKDLSRVAIRARWAEQIEQALARFGGKEAVAAKAGVDKRTIENWIGVKRYREGQRSGSHGRKKIHGVRVGTVPHDTVLATACDGLGISANYILFNRRPALLEDERTQDWVAGMCAWLAGELDVETAIGLDGPRIRSFLLACMCAGEEHDRHVADDLLPIYELATEILGHQCRGEDDKDGAHTYSGVGVGDAEERERWSQLRDNAEAEMLRRPYFGLLVPPMMRGAVSFSSSVRELEIDDDHEPLLSVVATRQTYKRVLKAHSTAERAANSYIESRVETDPVPAFRLVVGDRTVPSR